MKGRQSVCDVWVAVLEVQGVHSRQSFLIQVQLEGGNVFLQLLKRGGSNDHRCNKPAGGNHGPANKRNMQQGRVMQWCVAVVQRRRSGPLGHLLAM